MHKSSLHFLFEIRPTFLTYHNQRMFFNILTDDSTIRHIYYMRLILITNQLTSNILQSLFLISIRLYLYNE